MESNAKKTEWLRKPITKRILIAIMIAIFLYLSVGLVFAGATATDSLGVQVVYDKLAEIANDKAVTGIVAFFLAIQGLRLMMAEMILKGIFFFLLAFAMMKLPTIVDALTTATIPM